MDVVSLTMENKDLEAEKKLLEVTQMLSFLKTIKTEMNDDTAFETEFKTKQDAIKAILKDEKKTGVTLENIEEWFVEYTKHFELLEGEKTDRAEIGKAIAKPNDYKDKGDSKLDEAALTN
ncbi:14919_t:CDS:2, partial [Funneliformis geosporum]